jgi:hypothetical protein
MQPYFFPYIGYFQLIAAVDTFVFYDDVNFIKGGWINRNRIYVNGRVQYITVPCKQISSNKFIRDTAIDYSSRRFQQVLSTIELAYKKAPYFDLVYPVVARPLQEEYSSIAELAAQSILTVCNFLGLDRRFETSSVSHPDTVGLSRSNRLIAIAQRAGAAEYINPIGGESLYNEEEFATQKLRLQFISPALPQYPQASSDFIPGLSVIDVLMNNSKEKTLAMLNQYELS